MPYRMSVAESSVYVARKYQNPEGRTECVEFVRQVSGAPQTKMWKKGINVIDAGPGAIVSGTAIATFDDAGHYPEDSLGKHAAIYLSHSPAGIEVLDQWASQGAVKKRTIRANNHHSTSRSNIAETFYVIE